MCRQVHGHAEHDVEAGVCFGMFLSMYVYVYVLCMFCSYVYVCVCMRMHVHFSNRRVHYEYRSSSSACARAFLSYVYVCVYAYACSHLRRFCVYDMMFQGLCTPFVLAFFRVRGKSENFAGSSDKFG